MGKFKEIEKVEDNIIIRVLNSSDFKNDFLKLTYEDKITILKDDYLKRLYLNYCKMNNIYFFNKNECERALNNKEEKELVLNLNKSREYETIEYPDTVADIYLNDNNNYYLNLGILLKIIKNEEVLMKIIEDHLENDSLYDTFELVPDHILERLINDRRYKEYYYEIISGFKSDELKIKYLNRVSSFNRSSVISSLKSLELRERYLTNLTKMKGEIILTFPDDKKEEYLKKYSLFLTNEEKGEILASFDDINYLYKNIKYLNSSKAIYGFLSKIYLRERKLDKDFIISLLKKVDNQDNLFSLFFKANEEGQLIILDKMKGYDYLRDVIHYSKSINVKTKLFSMMPQSQLKKYFQENMDHYDYTALFYCDDKELIIEALKHREFDIKYNESVLPIDQILKIVSDYYNLNLSHLTILAKLTDCSILQYLENDNIKNAINLDEESFNNYLKIFDSKNINQDMNKINAVLTSVLQRQYSITNPEIIQIFIDTIHAVMDKDYDKATNKINEVCSVVDISKYNININDLINGIMNNNEDIIKLYNTITYEYIKLKRNEFVNVHIDAEIDGATYPKVEANDYLKYVFKIMPIDIIHKCLTDNCYLEEEYGIFKDNDKLLLDFIKFKKNPQEFGGITPEMKQNMKLFNEFCYRSFLRYFELCTLNPNIKREHLIVPIENKNLSLLMTNINTKKLNDLVLNDQELFQKLLDELEKYGMVSFGGRYDSISLRSDIELDESVIGSFISNYALIDSTRREKEEKQERFTFTSELVLASCLDGEANIYSQIFGFSDYQMIKRNPNPNSSPKNKKYRFDKAIEYMKQMHSRKYITVPPIDEDVALKSGKKINVMLGNTNDPINLTYGERTGACMRTGGAGESLFEFCLKNENGFHISFNNPETGALISRVSCFRNGNTLFLNQLRYSLNPNYSNDDIIEACKKIADLIIERTKNSKFPIENVVASNGYAYSKSKMIDIGVNDPRKTMPDFYTDVQDRVVLVASSADNGYVPAKLGSKNVELYQVGRSKVKKYENDKAKNAVAHIEACDLLYDGVDISDIMIEEKDVEYAYAGEDWYVALTSDGQIIKYVQRNSLNIEQANKEMNTYLVKLQNEINLGGDLIR